MVARAVPTLGGIRSASLARPMLVSAASAALRGCYVEAAARLRIALRRHLAAQCELYALPVDGTAEKLVERLRTADAGVGCFVEELLDTTTDIIALEDTGRRIGQSIELAFEIVTEDVR